MRNLQQIFGECLDEVKLLNIPVGKIDGVEWYDLKDKWGICIQHKKTNDFDIKISTKFRGEHIALRDLKSVICHEILHSCNGCLKHGKRWVHYALKIDETYGYGVAVYKTRFYFYHHDLPVLHRMICKNCGGSWEIKNPSDLHKIQRGVKVHCAWCGNYF